MSRSILSVTLHRETDTDPDLSYLGEYTSRDTDGAIDREARGDMGRCQYRYFVPAMTGEESGNPESPEHDYKRAESYNRGDWCSLYIFAQAEVQLTGDTVQRLRSGGLSGTESDSEEDYLRKIETEQLGELREELLAVGFSSRAIVKAFKSATRKS